ncbi:MAG TPA: DUF4350 domain-containing protein [Arenimonas sp.]|uniref:DUF4350 domain-containing protein n=1 Tax=Arenimonas sp. TaxID=1872635 RepID=UPI002BFE2A50|nr:DUF4350 domain-containing protein [Arenimonas sp.]HMB56288.1 DUF4350 domain-containing protein [Arenimonas sp.]
MNRRRWLFPLLIVAVIAVAVTAFLVLFEQVPQTLRSPPTGAGRYNPLYALERSLVAHGIDAHSHRRLELAAMKLQPGDGLLLYTDPRLLSQAQAAAVLAWVDNGGHLVVTMPPNDGGKPGALLEDIGVSAFGYDEDAGGLASSSCESLTMNRGASARDMLCSDSRFLPPKNGVLATWGNDERGYAYARFARGRGSVDVLADLDFLDSDHLDRDLNWQLAYQVLAPAFPKGRLHLVYNADVPSFWRIVLAHGWQVLLGLALMIATWIAMRSQRFGPLQPAAAPPRRALLEHVQAAGEHAWRRGAARGLHAALRDAFLARLRRRDPMAIALQGEARIDYLAKKLDTSTLRVRNALVPPPIFHAESFREAMATLIQLGLRI